MYLTSEFVGAFEYPYNLINISGETFKIRKINKKQETMLFNSFDEISKDLKTFIPTMYGVLIGSKEELIAKFKKAFSKNLSHIKASEKEFIDILETVASKYIFEYLCKEAGLTQGSFIDKCEEVIKKIQEEVDNTSTYLYKPFFEVLTERGYRMKEIFEMPGEVIIETSFKEIIFSRNANLLVYLANRVYNMQKTLNSKDRRSLGIPEFFRLFTEMNQSDSFDATEEIQKNIILYDACLNIFGERADIEKQEVEAKSLGGKVVIDGVEVDLAEREKVLKFIGAI